MGIVDDDIVAVREATDIVGVITKYTQLRRSGQRWVGLCPFHGEKTPSFVVTPSRETWKCFGCGRGGDIFHFVMERDGVDFRTALQTLASRAPRRNSTSTPLSTGVVVAVMWLLL